MSNVFLVTGLAGTGKSTLRDVFDTKGYDACDIDEGFASWQHQDTGEPVTYIGDEPADWHDTNHWLVEQERLKQRIEQQHDLDQPLIFFGFAANLSDFHQMFERIFLLAYSSDEIIAQRAISRPEEDAYGKRPIELARILVDRKPVQADWIALGAIAIDCTSPIEAITHFIEKDLTS